MTTPEIGAEAEVVLTVSPADTAARLAIGYWRALGIPAQSERAERWLRAAAD